MSAALRPPLIDPTALVDPRICPSCGAPLSGSSCASCGVDLSGPTARRVWELSLRAAAVLADRADALGDLRAEAARARTAPQRAVLGPGVAAAPTTATAPSTTSTPPGGPTPPAPHRPVAARPAPPRPRIGIQDLLLGVGALLVAVAAVVFLVVAWDRLSLGWRATVVGAVTVAALGASVRLRRALPATGEAIGAIGAALVLADAWAVRSTGLLGADRVAGDTYTAWACAACALLLAAWGIAGRVRVGTIAASVLAPLACVVAGAAAGPSGPAGDVAGSLGLVAAALVATVRVWTPPAWRTERVLLRVAAAVTLPATALVWLVDGRDRYLQAALLLLLTAVAAATQSVADARSLDRGALGLRRAFCGFAGLVAGAVGVPVGHGLVDTAGLGRSWSVAALPAVAALVAVVLAAALRPLARLRVRALALVAGADAVAVLLTAPAALVAALLAGHAAAASTPPWRFAAGTALGDVRPRMLARASDLLGAPHLVGGPVAGAQPAAVLGLLALAAGALGVRALLPVGPPRCALGRPVAAAQVAAGCAGAAVVLPLAPALTLAAVVGLLAAVAVAGAAAAALLPATRRPALVVRPALAVAAVAGTLAVLLSWAVPQLSVPVTLAGAAALVPARRLVPGRARAILLPVAVGSTTVAAGGAAGLAGLDVADRFTVAGLAAAAAVAALAVAPGRPARPGRVLLESTERVAAIAAAAVVLALAGLAAVVGGQGAAAAEPFRLALLLGAAALAAGVAAVGGPVGPGLRACAAGAVPALLAAAATASASIGLPPGAQPRPQACLAAAAVVALAGLAIAAAVLRTGLATDHRRVPLELGTAAAAVPALAVTPDQDRLWVVLLLLGVAAAAVSTAPDRRGLGWASWALLTLSSGLRLHLSDVGTVEAYTLPPALALLAVAALRVRSDRERSDRERSGRGRAALRAFAPGAGLALAPSIVASAGGGDLRPWLVLGAGAGLTGLAAPGRLRRVAPALLAAAVVAAGGTGLVRSVSRVATHRLDLLDVERWSLLGALLLVTATVVLARTAPRLHAVTGRWAVPAGLVVATSPVLLAVLDRPLEQAGRLEGLRAAGVLAAAAAVWFLDRTAVPGPLGRPARLFAGRPTRWSGCAVAVVAAVVGWQRVDVPVEVWSLPLGVLLLAHGALALRDDAGLRSGRPLAAGLAVVLAPSLLLVLRSPDPWRVAGLAVLGGAVLVVGAVRRLRAPVSAACVTLTVLAVDQLGPRVLHLVTVVPQWVSLSLVGLVLLVVGATYERRVRELRALRTSFAALR